MGGSLRPKRSWRASAKAQLVNASFHQIAFDATENASGWLDHAFCSQHPTPPAIESARANRVSVPGLSFGSLPGADVLRGANPRKPRAVDEGRRLPAKSKARVEQVRRDREHGIV